MSTRNTGNKNSQQTERNSGKSSMKNKNTGTSAMNSAKSPSASEKARNLDQGRRNNSDSNGM